MTRVQVWCAGYLRGFAYGFAVASILLFALLMMPFGPPPGRSFGIVALDLTRADMPSADFQLNGETLFVERRRAIGETSQVLAAKRSRVAGTTAVLGIGRYEYRDKSFVGPEFTVHTGGRDCRVVVHLRPDRIDVSDCLFPVARP